ncbi:endonuclease/exonuclease/phosphatase family protein [Sandarakinorhabdus sp. AAP62]|uniref:endonuclease/exonuclease/phosphatase family protein n=1 Tax=Sandarakinorhabdus sp. AAP62 TaxID=1248916 RepID=UPI00030A8C08|nr:endonuclease/exonuclease/phosphatase family protein [Sandarakinorhabdus sp. AAP62]
MIRIVTLNIWKDEGDWPARMAAIAAGLAALQPDVVCLQEVYVGGGRDAGQWLAAATGLACTQLAARHKLRGGVASSSGVAILSRTAPIGTMAIGLPTTLADGGRKALVADFTTVAGPLRVASLHLSHVRTPDASALRAAQLSALVAAADCAGPLVLAGDFNARWDAPELALLSAPGWVSSATMLAGQSSLIGQPDALIDHVVLRAGTAALALNEARIVLDHPDAAGVLPSDHAGILAVLAAI